MLLLALFACATSASTDTSDEGSGGCFAGPSVTITSPENDAKLPAGEPVALTMDVHSETDDSTLRLLWAVMPPGGNTDNQGTHSSETWTPSLDDVGLWTIFAQAEDTCTDSLGLNPVQDTVKVEVIATE